MANPRRSDAHLRVAHSIGEQLMVSHFSEQQRRILDFILRLSWGCGHESAYIPHQKDFEVVGVRQGHVKGHLDWLIEARVIVREGSHYRFNKDFDQWRVSRAHGYTSKRLTELVTLNLNNKRQKVTDSVSDNEGQELRKTEAENYGKRKPPTPELRTPKEILKKDTTLPSSIPPKNGKGDPRVTETMLTLEAKQGYKFAHYAREVSAVKRALNLGYTPEQIVGCWEKLKRDAFWRGKALPLATVARELGEYVKGAGERVARQYSSPEELLHGG